MGLFNSDDNEDEIEGQEDDRETLIHQVVRLRVEEAVDDANTWIRRVNREGWDLYLIPDDPSLNQLETMDEELDRLYQKVSERRPCDRQERAKIMHARQAVREIIEMYSVYDSISVPVDEPSSPNSGEDDGGVTNAV